MIEKILQRFNFRNEWLEKYASHIADATFPFGMSEAHHIFPKCVFGENDETIYLSTLDHFKAHWLLYKAFREEREKTHGSVILPSHFRGICFSMSSFNQVNGTRRKSLSLLTEDEVIEYGRLICEARDANTIAMIGDLNPAKRPEVRKLISERNTGRKTTPLSPEKRADVTNRTQATMKERGYDSSDTVFVYHKVSGEVCRVYKCVVDMLPDSWGLGQKTLPNDDLYWPQDYLSLKQSLKLRENDLCYERPWIAEKINKNPEKIRKTAEKHRGMKRSGETRSKQSEFRKKLIEEKGGPLNKGHKQYYHPDDPKNKHIQCIPGNEPDGWILGNWMFVTKVIGQFTKNGNIYELHQRVYEDFCYLKRKTSKNYEVKPTSKEKYVILLKEAGFEELPNNN